MALVNSSGYAHVRITVTDIERSKAFYDRLFGWPAAIDTSGDVADAQADGEPGNFFGGTIYQTPQGTLFGLRPTGAERFDPGVTGLDHVSFAVDSREELVRAVEGLDEAGIPHGDIIDLTDAGLAILSIQDPDDINIELTAPLG